MNRYLVVMVVAFCLTGCLQQARDEHDERADRIHVKLQRARRNFHYCQNHPDKCADGDLERYQEAIERYQYALERNDRELERTEESHRATAEGIRRVGEALQGEPERPATVVFSCANDSECPGLSVCTGATFTRKGLCTKR